MSFLKNNFQLVKQLETITVSHDDYQNLGKACLATSIILSSHLFYDMKNLTANIEEGGSLKYLTSFLDNAIYIIKCFWSWDT